MMLELAPQDRLDILALIRQADRAATERDVTAYLSLFLPDAVHDRGAGGHDGADLAETLRDTLSHEGPDASISPSTPRSSRLLHKRCPSRPPPARYS